MKHYYYIRIKTTQKTNLLLKLNHLGVDIKNISYNAYYLTGVILASDLKRIEKYLPSYKVEVLSDTGIYKIRQELKKHNLFLTGLIFSIILFLILSNLIVKVNIIHENTELRTLLEEALTDMGVTPLSFKKSYEEYESIIATIKDMYPDKIEWLEIEVQGMVINVRVEQRIINDYEKEYATCHVTASKSGIIKSITTTKGEVAVSINDYVSAGDILINGNIMLNEEIKQSVCASGSVYAEVWYQVQATVPLTETVSKDTGKMRYNIMIKKGSEEYVLLKDRIGSDKRVEDIYLFSIFGIEIYLQKEYEISTEEITYSLEEATEKAIKMINEKLMLQLDDFEEIIEEKVLQNTIKNNNIYIDMFVAVKEQIGVKTYFDARSDTLDEEYNGDTNGVN